MSDTLDTAAIQPSSQDGSSPVTTEKEFFSQKESTTEYSSTNKSERLTKKRRSVKRNKKRRKQTRKRAKPLDYNQDVRKFIFVFTFILCTYIIIFFIADCSDEYETQICSS